MFFRIVPPLKRTERAQNDETATNSESGSNDKTLSLCLNINYERMYTPPLYCLSQLDISEDLARLHPEFTIAMLSGTCPDGRTVLMMRRQMKARRIS